MMLSTLLFVGLAIAAPAPQSDQRITVPLPDRHVFVRATGDVDGPAILKNLNDTLKKYDADTFVPSYPEQGLEKRLSTEALVDQAPDVLYYGPITLGSQQFTMDFDTGSSDIFVPGPQCDANAGCPHSTKYNQKGVDQNRATSVTYGSGQISGEDFRDSLTVAGLTSTGQGFISLTQADGFSDSNADGLLGMGFTEIANSGFVTYFESLIAQSKVTVQEFAFYLGRAASGTGQKSELALGGRDSLKFSGDVTQVPVTKRGYWQVALDSVNVNKKSTGPATKGQAAIDTGTTLIIAPTAAALQIYGAIPGAFPVPLVSGSPTQTLFAYPCNTQSDFIPAIQFAGKSFAIASGDFNLGRLTIDFSNLIGNSKLLNYLLNALLPPVCLGAIVGADLDPTQNLYVVGDTFLKNWYSIYNYVNAPGGKPSVSFAKSVG